MFCMYLPCLELSDGALVEGERDDDAGVDHDVHPLVHGVPHTPGAREGPLVDVDQPQPQTGQHQHQHQGQARGHPAGVDIITSEEK